jgi:N-methylhydantoinase A
MSYRISCDTGGTFTDIVVSDEHGRLELGKAPTTRARAYAGLREGVAQVAERLGLTVEELLAQTEVLTYGTTRATNAIVEGATARTAFFTTEGFPDTLLIREGGKPDPFKQIPYPPPYVPRWLTFEIRERMDAEGEAFVPLDEASVVDAISRARELQAEAIAVCLLWSIVNPAHEQRVGELIEEHWPGIPYTLSSSLNPIIREYRRASSTAIDASLKPLMQEYLSTMERDLREAGFAGHLLIATSFGGAWRPEQVVDKPIYSVGSGPSMAPVAALIYGRAEFGEEEGGDLVVCDTGGTTFDVGLVSGGLVNATAETWLGGRWTGHITGIRSVDVKSIGSGGGSVIWIDPGGLLRVGPRSAGAEPGPACYGRGGTEPTVTDAAVVLGWIDPAYFLGGLLSLDAGASRRVLETIAAPLGMSVEEAAYAALTIATENVIGAIREITIAQGIDPREFSLVAGGGASGLNVVPIARELGSKRVLLPSTAGALSACGALFSDVISEFPRSRYVETRTLDHEAVNEVLADIEAQADAFLAGLSDIDPVATRKEFTVEARYRGQIWELDVPIPSRIADRAGVEALEEAFHETHERVFAVREPGQYLECLLWKVRATAVPRKPAVAASAKDGGSLAPAHVAPAYFRETGLVDVPSYDGESLPRGARIEGPALIREPTTTVVAYPGSTVTVSQLGNYLLEVQP